jgi:hypothetical protein
MHVYTGYKEHIKACIFMSGIEGLITRLEWPVACVIKISFGYCKTSLENPHNWLASSFSETCIRQQQVAQSLSTAPGRQQHVESRVSSNGPFCALCVKLTTEARDASCRVCQCFHMFYIRNY